MALQVSGTGYPPNLSKGLPSGAFDFMDDCAKKAEKEEQKEAKHKKHRLASLPTALLIRLYT